MRPEPLLPRESDPQLQEVGGALLEAPGCAVITVGRDHAIRFANAAARAALGAEEGAQLAGVAPELAAAADRILAGEASATGPLVERGDACFATYLVPLARTGDEHAAICICLDAGATGTAVRRMSASAELAREQDAIINSTSDGLWISDANATVLRVNPASERLNEIEAREVVGRNMRDLVAEGLFDRSATLEVIRTKAPVHMLQNRGGRKLMLTGIPVFDEAHRLIRVVVNEKDITEIDRLQRQLEEQEAIQDRYRHQMLEMHLEEAESQRLVARSPSMQKVLRQAIKLSSVDSTVLLLGASGVGKGLIADLIHKHSSRAEKPLIKINCGAIPESLVEAELFGYEKGAFTGAQSSGKAGYFEVANGGILFLDEVAELPLSAQVKLLRFLEDGRVTRVGGTQSRVLNVRIIAATHRDLQAMVNASAFRLDLYYRLNVIPLHIPPLRERLDCIVPALRHYLAHFCDRVGVRRRFSRAASQALLAYSWPGNVRELINLCERLVVMTDSEVIDLDDLPADIVASVKSASSAAFPEDTTLAQAVESTERALLVRARQSYHSQLRMAKALGIDQSTVARKMRRYGIT